MDDYHIDIISIESFLRRASKLDLSFMAKGSIITRQFFPKPDMRKVQDSDWVYLNSIDTEEEAERLFSDWVIAITEDNSNGDIRFRSFQENRFWRRVDYAMNDDFPTVNTDLICYVNGIENDRFHLDISFNLEIEYPPESILYQPIQGEPFLLKSVCPFPLQVSWKLHQLLVRPRLKDVFDLIHLLNHERFDSDVFYKVIYALKKECKRDNISVLDLACYIDGSVIDFYTLIENNDTNSSALQKLKELIPKHDYLDYQRTENHRHFTKQEHFPYASMAEIFDVFKLALIEKGFTIKYLSYIY